MSLWEHCINLVLPVILQLACLFLFLLNSRTWFLQYFLSSECKPFSYPLEAAVEIAVTHKNIANVINKFKSFTKFPYSFPFENAHLASLFSLFCPRTFCSWIGCSVFFKICQSHNKQVVHCYKLVPIVSEKIQLQWGILRVSCCLIPGWTQNDALSHLPNVTLKFYQWVGLFMPDGLV